MLRDVLNNLDRYLIEHCTLEDLEVWLMSNLQGILDSDDQVGIEVANQVDADLVELGESLIDELTFRERLESYVKYMETILIVFSETEPRATVDTTATVETVTNCLEEPRPVADLRLAHVFA